MQRTAQALNALLVVLAISAVAYMIHESPFERDFLVKLGLAMVVPSGVWFIASKVPASFTATLLAILVNAMGVFFAMIGFGGFLLLGAATGSRADMVPLLLCLVWLATGAMNIRTAWDARPRRNIVNNSPHEHLP